MNLHDRDIRWIALAEGKQIGLQEGAEQKAIETAKKLLQEGLTVEQIARCTDLPLEKVQELANITQN
jgi:predicted transposase/invertase (TIGR01784 family)